MDNSSFRSHSPIPDFGGPSPQWDDFKKSFEIFERCFPFKDSIRNSPVKKEHLKRYTEEVLSLTELAMRAIGRDPYNYRGVRPTIEELNADSIRLSPSHGVNRPRAHLTNPTSPTKQEVDNLLEKIQSIYNQRFSPSETSKVPEPKHRLILHVVWGERARVGFYENAPVSSSLVNSVLEDVPPLKDAPSETVEKSLEDVPPEEVRKQVDKRGIDLIEGKGDLVAFKELFPDIKEPVEACRAFTSFLLDPTTLKNVNMDRLIDIWTLAHYYGASDGITLCNDECERKLQNRNIDTLDLLKRRYRRFLAGTVDNPSKLQELLEFHLKALMATPDFQRRLDEIPFLKISFWDLKRVLGLLKGDVWLKVTFNPIYGTSVDEGFLGNWDQHTMKLLKGKRTLPDGGVNEGDFDPNTGFLCKGKATLPDGEVREGDWDPNTGFLCKGKVTRPNGTVEDGDFDPNTRRLFKGKVTWPDGKVTEGEWDPNTGRLLKGKVTLTDGAVWEGDWDPNTGRLRKGKVTQPNGTVEDGDWDPNTGRLLKGKVTRPNGEVLDGDWDPNTGSLCKGKVTRPNGTVEDGDWDPNTGRLLKGKVTRPNGEVQDGDWDPNTGRLRKGKITSPDGKVTEGDWDPNTGRLRKGKITSPDGKVVEGDFDPNTGRLRNGKVTLRDGTVQYVGLKSTLAFLRNLRGG